jgi:7,8-dihydroneopterin aldolase/epimerase/oxygenase
MDIMQIDSLAINTYIGIYEWEKHNKQQLLLDITVYLTIKDCQENIDNTINYAVLCHEITEFVQSKAFALIETVALEVVALVKSRFAIEKIKIRVNKPTAVSNAQNVSVTLER